MKKNFIVEELTYISVGDEQIDMRNEVILFSIGFEAHISNAEIKFMPDPKSGKKVSLSLIFSRVQRLFISGFNKKSDENLYVQHVGYMDYSAEYEETCFITEEESRKADDLFIQMMSGAIIRINAEIANCVISER